MAPFDEAAVLELGYLAARQLPSGVWIGVFPQLYTTGLFVGIDRGGYRRRFCFEHFAGAMRACLTWDGEGDPPGDWIKEKPSDRMNPRWLADARREMETG